MPVKKRKLISRENILLVGAGVLIGLGIGVVLYYIFIDKSSITILKDRDFSLAPEVGGKAPGFELRTFSGDLESLDMYSGKPVIVNFWATWCGPCRLEMPIFQRYHDENSDDIVVMTINAGESREDIERFLNEMELDLRVLLDDEHFVESLYRVQGLPSTFFIDEEGIIRYKHLGIITEGQVQGYLEEMGISYD